MKAYDKLLADNARYFCDEEDCGYSIAEIDVFELKDCALLWPARVECAEHGGEMRRVVAEK